MESKRSTNLCSSYILPLLDLNKESFGGSDNFINSYVNDDDSIVIVQLSRPYAGITTNKFYKFDFTRDNSIYYVFDVPGKFLPTVRKFREGKYSQFQEEAKNVIKKRSGLSWRVTNSKGGVTTARELLALDRDKSLREYLEKNLSGPGSPVIISPEAELMDIPNEGNFYKLNLVKSSDLEIIQ